jgi:excisionase family DNA binding protein
VGPAAAEPILSAAEVANALGVSRRWVYARVEEHGLPAYRPPGGRMLLFRMSAVEAWLDAHRIGEWGSCASDPADAEIQSKLEDQQTG